MKTNKTSPWSLGAIIADEWRAMFGSDQETSVPGKYDREIFEDALGQLACKHIEGWLNRRQHDPGALTVKYVDLIEVVDPEAIRDFSLLRMAFFAGCRAYEDAITLAATKSGGTVDPDVFDARMNQVHAELHQHWEDILTDTKVAKQAARR